MSTLICPAGRVYRVTSRDGSNLAVFDPADGFRFPFLLTRERLARGWRLEGSNDKPERTRRGRSQPRRKKVKPR